MALISCTASPSTTPSVLIPHMYSRALSVYDSLLIKTRKQDILTACYDQSKGVYVIDEALKLLQSALSQVISFLWNESIYECEDLFRQCLILALTLFTNYIMLLPRSSDISKFRMNLNLCLELKMKFTFECKYETLCTTIKQARSTSDFLKAIEYLLCPCTSSGRYEALAAVGFSKKKRRITINVLSDEDVRNLPPVVILGSDNFPKAMKTQELEVSPLLPEVERRNNLSFQLHFQGSKYALGKLRDSCGPSWMHLPAAANSTQLADPEILEFIDLGFPQQDIKKKVQTIENGTRSVCQVCKVRIREDHKNLSLIHI